MPALAVPVDKVSLLSEVRKLAPKVIEGCTRIAEYLPVVKEFLEKSKELPRDKNNRWLEPIEGCYSVREFFVNKCHRTPQTMYEHIRKSEEKPAKKKTNKTKTFESSLRKVNQILKTAETLLEEGQLETIPEYVSLSQIVRQVKALETQIRTFTSGVPPQNLAKYDAWYMYETQVKNLSVAINEFHMKTEQGISNPASAKDIFSEFKQIMLSKGWRHKVNYDFVRMTNEKAKAA